MLKINRQSGPTIQNAQVLLEIAETVRPQTAPILHEEQIRWEHTHKEFEEGTIGTILIPSRAPPVLFRGQNRRYAPCVPSISRGHRRLRPAVFELASEDQISLVVNLTRTRWFIRELSFHPAMLWAKSQRIHVNEWALAQHYEIPTGFVDVTQSWEVACFFATCRPEKGGDWQGMKEGAGVIYRIDYAKAPKPFDVATPIGLQPFPRPAEQWGWVVELALGQDFEQLPWVSRIEFAHDERISKHFLRKFHGGADLFPPDIMADVAARIKASDELPHDLLRITLEDLAEDRFGLSKRKIGKIEARVGKQFRLVERKSLMSAGDLASLETLWNSRKDEFFRHVGVRLVRTRTVRARESRDGEA